MASSSAATPGTHDALAVRKRKKPKHTIYHLSALNVDHDQYNSGHSGSGANEGLGGDYKKQSLSSEYYKRHYQLECLEAERNREKLMAAKSESYSPGCYVFWLILTSAVICFLAIYISNASDVRGEIVKKSARKTFVCRNKVFTVMSENLDCSLHMKRLSITGEFGLQGAVRQGITCISLMVPYSSAGIYSSFSMMSYFIRSVESQIANYFNQVSWEEEEEDPMLSYNRIPTALLRSENGKRDEQLADAWLERWSSRHLEAWLRHTWSSPVDMPEGLTRSFPIPHQLVNHLHRLNGTHMVHKWMKYFSLTDKEDLTKQRIYATYALSQELRMPDVDNETEISDCVVLSYPIYRRDKFFEKMKVVYPYHMNNSESTFSVFSAFIISTVTKVFSDPTLAIPESDRDVLFFYVFLRAQQAAFSFFPYSQEFSTKGPRRPTQKRLLHTYHLEAAKVISQDGYIASPDVTVNRVHRVTSIAVWSRNRLHNWPITFTMSRLYPFQIPFKRRFDSNDTQRLTRFQHKENGSVFKSSTFTASADIIMLKSNRNKEQMITHVITASGSVRTFEAVAMTALRMLLFDEDVDEAILAKSGFYDVRNGKFFCEDKAMIRALFEKYKFVCHEIPEHDFEANDRVVMAAHIHETESELQNHMHAVINSRINHNDYNYAVGY